MLAERPGPKTRAMDTPSPSNKTTTAFYAQSAAAFAISLMAMLIAIYYLPYEPWPKAFLALGTLFLVTSSFSLAKCVRDAQESQYVVSRLDQARVDRILADHNPWKEVGRASAGAGGGDRHDEPAAVLDVLDGHPPAVDLDQPTDDGQAEARAAAGDHRLGARRPRGLAAESHVEDAVDVLTGDATTPVADAQLHLARQRPPADLHRAVARRVPDRVHQQVADDAGHRVGVHVHDDVRVHLAVEADALDSRHGLGRGQGLADQVTEGDGLGRRVEEAGVDLGELEEVVDHPHRAVHLGTDLPVV